MRTGIADGSSRLNTIDGESHRGRTAEVAVTEYAACSQRVLRKESHPPQLLLRYKRYSRGGSCALYLAASSDDSIIIA